MLETVSKSWFVDRSKHACNPIDVVNRGLLYVGFVRTKVGLGDLGNEFWFSVILMSTSIKYCESLNTAH